MCESMLKDSMHVRMYVCMCMCVTKLRVKDGVCVKVT